MSFALDSASPAHDKGRIRKLAREWKEAPVVAGPGADLRLG